MNDGESARLFDVDWWNYHAAAAFFQLFDRRLDFLDQKVGQPMRRYVTSGMLRGNAADVFTLVDNVQIIGVNFTRLKFPTKEWAIKGLSGTLIRRD